MKIAILSASLFAMSLCASLGAISVTGADPTGQADSTAAIQAAMNTRGEVDIPAGTYLINGTLRPWNGGLIKGEGRGATKLVSSGTQPIILISSTMIKIQSLEIQAPNPINIPAGAGEVTIDDVFLNAYTIGIATQSSLCLTNSELWTSTPSAIGVQFNCAITEYAFMQHVLIDSYVPEVTCAGIVINGLGALQASDCLIVQQGTGLLINATTQVTQIYFHNNIVDTCINGITIEPTGGTVWGTRIDNNWIVNCSGGGVILGGASSVLGVDIANCHIFDDVLSGVAVYSASVSDVHIIGCSISTSQKGIGVYVAPGASRFSVKDCTIGGVDNTPSNGYGIMLGGNNSKFMITGNDLTWNYTNGVAGSQEGDSNFLINNNLQ